MSETNYERYFGTPEKVAEYLAENLMCEDCERYGICSADTEGCKFALREWLESEAE